MAEFVSRVKGVKEIQNQIGVLPVSALDNRLRIELARNIYGNPHCRSCVRPCAGTRESG